MLRRFEDDPQKFGENVVTDSPQNVFEYFGNIFNFLVEEFDARAPWVLLEVICSARAGRECRTGIMKGTNLMGAIRGVYAHQKTPHTTPHINTSAKGPSNTLFTRSSIEYVSGARFVSGYFIEDVYRIFLSAFFHRRCLSNIFPKYSMRKTP